MENLFWIYVLLGTSVFIGILNLVLFVFIATFLVRMGDAVKTMFQMPTDLPDLANLLPPSQAPDDRGLVEIDTPQLSYDPRFEPKQ